LKCFAHVASVLEMKRVMKKTKPASKKPKAGRKQPSKTSKSRYAKTPGEGFSPDGTEIPPTVRFSATIHARDESDPKLIEKLDIDRVPDPTGVIRALVTPEDCVRLVNQGFEVRLHNAYPVEPLNPALIETDDSFKRWIDAKMASITGARKLKGSKGN
jgi:hypothetical protein